MKPFVKRSNKSKSRKPYVVGREVSGDIPLVGEEMQCGTGGPEGREQLCLDARGSVLSKPEARTQEQLLHQRAQAWSSPEYEPEGQENLFMILKTFKFRF